MQAKRRKRTMADYAKTTTNGYTICAAVESARRIGNQWRLIVNRDLLEHPMRFKQLLKDACDIYPQTLSPVLKYLTKEQNVRREVLETPPLTVPYEPTDKG